MQTVLQQTAGERSPWLIACGANTKPRQFSEGDWCNEAGAFVKVLETSIATYTKASYCGAVENLLDDFVSSTSNQTNVRRVRIVEGFGSMPHKPVQCGVEMAKSQKTYLWSAAEELAGRKCQVSEAATKKTKLTTAETSNRAR